MSDRDDVGGPRPIVQLGQDVINKIAAAEIIHRPSNAIKELLENSLDAGSTSIKITIREGGLKLIQIADNGHGISRADLPLLCTRYATSKLREFKDLESIATYGFRGEALASISYCSLVEVVTKTRADGCGWRANYANGVLVAAKAGSSPDPKPAAANDGTIISAEDLFFNMPIRKRAFRSASDEYNRILDVVTKYAVHNPHCAWVCKKAGSNLPDLTTPISPNSSSRHNIALLYTQSLADDLIEVPDTALTPASLSARVKGWVSNANANWARKGGWLLFINNRLVDSGKIRKAIEAMYTAFLPKGASPWVYLSLHIDPAKVDVNVHPTKSEVHFLNEDEIIDSLVSVVHTALQGANTSRSFTVQTILPGASDPSDRPSARQSSGNHAHPLGEGSAVARKKAAPNYKIRNDLATQTLEAMFAPSGRHVGTYEGDGQADGESSRAAKRRRFGGASVEDALDVEAFEDEGGGGGGGIAQAGDGDDDTLINSKMGNVLRGWKVEESVCEFTSIRELRDAVRKRSNAEACDMMAKHAFVGIVEESKSLALVQHGTQLHLINYAHLADQHFYQLGLRQFGALDRLKLDPPPDLRDLLEIGLQDEPLSAHGLELDDVATKMHELLLDKRDMVDEYFSLRTSDEGMVESIPMLIRGYVPDLDRLPHLLVCLATRVDWTSEKECFQGVLKELAFFYSPRLLHPSSDPRPSDGQVSEERERDEGNDTERDETETAQQKEQRLWQLEHVLFPSFRKYTAWPAMGRDAVQVANLPDLFRIFERC